MRRLAALASVAMTGLSGCAGPASPTPTPALQAWIGIYDPAHVMSLEIDGTAWGPITPATGGGVVMPYLTERTVVRLFGVPDCHVYASFGAGPGSAHLIQFDADGSVSIEDWTGQPQEMGPGLVEAPPSGCDA